MLFSGQIFSASPVKCLPVRLWTYKYLPTRNTDVIKRHGGAPGP